MYLNLLWYKSAYWNNGWGFCLFVNPRMAYHYLSAGNVSNRINGNPAGLDVNSDRALQVCIPIGCCCFRQVSKEERLEIVRLNKGIVEKDIAV